MIITISAPLQDHETKRMGNEPRWQEKVKIQKYKNKNKM